VGISFGLFFLTIDSAEPLVFDTTNYFDIFKKSIFGNFRLWILIMFAGLFVPLKPLAPFALFCKGFSIGFTIQYLSILYGAKGFLLIFINSLPHFLFSIPILIYYATCAFKTRHKKQWLIKSAFIFVIISLCSVFDGFVTPIFLNQLLGILN